MLRVVTVGRLVLLERLGTTVVEEVDLDTLLSALVGGGKLTVEVRKQLDLLTLDLTGGEDAGNLDADIGLGVCFTHAVSVWDVLMEIRHEASIGGRVSSYSYQ